MHRQSKKCLEIKEAPWPSGQRVGLAIGGPWFESRSASWGF